MYVHISSSNILELEIKNVQDSSLSGSKLGFPSNWCTSSWTLRQNLSRLHSYWSSCCHQLVLQKKKHIQCRRLKIGYGENENWHVKPQGKERWIECKKWEEKRLGERRHYGTGRPKQEAEFREEEDNDQECTAFTGKKKISIWGARKWKEIECDGWGKGKENSSHGSWSWEFKWDDYRIGKGHRTRD